MKTMPETKRMTDGTEIIEEGVFTLIPRKNPRSDQGIFKVTKKVLWRKKRGVK